MQARPKQLTSKRITFQQKRDKNSEIELSNAKSKFYCLGERARARAKLYIMGEGPGPGSTALGRGPGPGPSSIVW